MELIRYLHLNPVRAGLISDPSRYRWSSHRNYLGGKSDSGLAVDRGLALWGTRHGPAMQAYRQFIRDGLTDGHREEYYEVKEQQYLGDDGFVEVVHQAVDKQKESRPVKIRMADILYAIVREAEVSDSVVRNKGRGRMGSRLRAEAAYIAREVGGIGLTEAAKYLGRDPSTMSLALKRLEEELAGNRQKRNRLARLCAGLRQGRRHKYQTSKA
jgi:DNA-binding MarR family transcriptional regulator